MPHKKKVSRSANIVRRCVDVFNKIRLSELEPDVEGKEALDMTQYTKLFGHARIPQQDRDKLVFNKSPRHVLVIHK